MVCVSDDIGKYSTDHVLADHSEAPTECASANHRNRGLSLICIASATAFNAPISLQTLSLHMFYFFPISFTLIQKFCRIVSAYGIQNWHTYCFSQSLCFILFSVCGTLDVFPAGAPSHEGQYKQCGTHI